MAFTLKNGAYPQDLAYDMYDPYHYIRSQKVNGKEYMIAGGEDHRTGESENAEASFLRLESYVRKHFDVIQEFLVPGVHLQNISNPQMDFLTLAILPGPPG
jgi:hypothetical protein